MSLMRNTPDRSYAGKAKNIFKLLVTDIKALTQEQCEMLQCGDIVLKKTGNQYHQYVVSYKENKHGMCLTYCDASCSETVSYDCISNVWTYNSTDITPLYTHDSLVQDVNDAIEEGEIEVGSESPWTAIKDDEDRVIGVQFEYYNEGESLYNTFSIVFDQVNFSLIINPYLPINCYDLTVLNLLQTKQYQLGNSVANNDRKICDVNGSQGTAGQVLGKDANNKLTWMNLSGGTQLYQHSIVSGDDRFYIITTNSSPMSYDDVVYNCWEYNGNIISIIYHDDSANRRHVCITDDTGMGDGASGIKSIAYIHNGAIVVKTLPTSGSDTVTPL